MTGELLRTIDRAMTVGQLIEMLEDYDKDAVVVYQYPSGDYWRTVLASTVQEVGQATVEYSEYHRQLSLVEDEDKCDDKEEIASVVMIF